MQLRSKLNLILGSKDLVRVESGITLSEFEYSFFDAMVQDIDDAPSKPPDDQVEEAIDINERQCTPPLNDTIGLLVDQPSSEYCFNGQASAAVQTESPFCSPYLLQGSALIGNSYVFAGNGKISVK